MKQKYKFLTLAPFSYSIPSVGTSTKLAICMFIPQIVLLILSNSFLSVMQILITILASVCADMFFSFIKKKSLVPSIIVYFQGLLIGMFVPEGYSLFSLFFITLISLFVFSYMFGGFAQSWGNPIAITVILLYLIGTQFFPDFTVTASHLQNPNLGQQLVNDGLIPKLSCDGNITNFLNSKIFKYAGVALPEGYVSIFWDTGSLIPAFRFNLATLISTLVLISFGALKCLIPVVYLVTYAILVRIFGLFPFGGMLNQGDILIAIFSSGTIISAFFLLQWAGTTPLSIIGKIIYGIIGGVLAFTIIGCGTSPIGSMFVILITNLISPLIQFIEEIVYIQFLRIKGNSHDR